MTAGGTHDPAANLRAAIEMYEVGEAMMRQRLRREHPLAGEVQIEAEIDAWLRRRPGAEHGDFPGPRSTRRI